MSGNVQMPTGWRLVRLGDVAEVSFSGVDKRTIDGEFHVKLCNYEDVERFAHVAGLGEIEGNDFNLNISRCVDTTGPVEVMPVEVALAQLREAERRRGEAVPRMDSLLAELGYAR